MKCYYCPKDAVEGEIDRETGTPCCSTHGDGPVHFKLVHEVCPTHETEVHYFVRWETLSLYLKETMTLNLARPDFNMGIFGIYKASPMGWTKCSDRFVRELNKRPELN